MQIAFLLTGVLVLAFEVWWGWRVGVMRTLTSIVALVGSALIGLAAGSVVAAINGGGEVVFWGTAAIVLVVVYIAIWLFGFVMFKKTSQQPMGLHFIWGMGGAALGFVLGVLVLWLSIPAVRTVGAFGEGRKQTYEAYYLPVPLVTGTMAAVKTKLETGLTGKIFSSFDIASPDLYDIVEKLSRFSADPETCLARFMEYPDLKAVANLPEVQAMTTDPQVLAAIENQNMAALLTNPALMKLARDKKVSEMIMKIDFRKALDYAVGETPKNE